MVSVKNSSKLDTNRMIGYRFVLLHRVYIALARADLLKLGITPSLVPFLTLLLDDPEPLTQDELSLHLHIDKAATSRAIEQLEKKGWIKRWVNPENRRQKLVTATPKANKIASDLFSVIKNASLVYSRGFSEEELLKALELMDRMILNMVEECNGRQR